MKTYEKALKEYQTTNKKVKVVSLYELKNIVKTAPLNADLNFLDVSNVEDMAWMFRESNFNQDIYTWNLNNLKNAKGIFQNSKIQNYFVFDKSTLKNLVDELDYENKNIFQGTKFYDKL